jgi:hypothetical protein
MSWTDIFPHFDDDDLAVFDEASTNEDREKLAELFQVVEVINPRLAEHVVSASLFWKPTDPPRGPMPPVTRELLQDPAAHGFEGRQSNPWKHYVEPLFAGARILAEKRPDVVFRVYLANDLAFVISELVEAGCEVYLMESSSIGMQPGMMWRFLALEHQGLVTVTDSDRAQDVIHDVERTERVAEAGLSHWRVAYTCGQEAARQALPTHYRPVLACQFGSAKAYPMKYLMSAFIWSCWHGKISTELGLGPERRMVIMGSHWPDYGFDEWFLQTAFFPRMAFHGVLSFVPWGDRSLNQWFALDIEYCTWANLRSEIFYHGDPVVHKEDVPDPIEIRIEANLAENLQPA